MADSHLWDDATPGILITCALPDTMAMAGDYILAPGWGLAMPWPNIIPSGGPGTELHLNWNEKTAVATPLACATVMNFHKSRKNLRLQKPRICFILQASQFCTLPSLSPGISIAKPYHKGQGYLLPSGSPPIKICFQNGWINSYWVT